MANTTYPQDIPLEQDITVDLTESQIEVVYANQYDDSMRTVNCHIQDEGIDFDCTGYTVSLWIKKANGFALSRTIGSVDEEGNVFGSVSGNIVSFPITKEMTYSYGRQLCNLELKKSGDIYSCPFYLRVNEASVQQSDIFDSDDYKSIHDDYMQLRKYVDSLSHEMYTTTHTPPANQKDGDFWLEIL